jgi:hypothetical protein
MVILGKFWSIFDLRQRRNQKFLVDDQGCFSEQTVLTNLWSLLAATIRGSGQSRHRRQAGEWMGNPRMGNA